MKSLNLICREGMQAFLRSFCCIGVLPSSFSMSPEIKAGGDLRGYETSY